MFTDGNPSSARTALAMVHLHKGVDQGVEGKQCRLNASTAGYCRSEAFQKHGL